MGVQGCPRDPASCQRAAISASLSTRSRETSRAGRGVASQGFVSSDPRRTAQPQHARAWARSRFAAIAPCSALVASSARTASVRVSLPAGTARHGASAFWSSLGTRVRYEADRSERWCADHCSMSTSTV